MDDVRDRGHLFEQLNGLPDEIFEVANPQVELAGLVGGQKLLQGLSHDGGIDWPFAPQILDRPHTCPGRQPCDSELCDELAHQLFNVNGIEKLRVARPAHKVSVSAEEVRAELMKVRNVNSPLRPQAKRGVREA
jgi:hypothetical protein